MTDIVERLEDVSAIIQKEFGRVAGAACLSAEAAAEIRRLREQCEAMADAADNVLKSKASSASMSVLRRRLAAYRASEKG